MAQPSIVLRPGRRASIFLPWRDSSSANFIWLKEVCGQRTRPTYNATTKRFEVARKHAQYVLDALVEEYGKVEVVQYGNIATTCVERCWSANPNTVIDCECGCAGLNHGVGQPLGEEVTAGLSVQNDLVSATYIVTADGWKLQSR